MKKVLLLLLLAASAAAEAPIRERFPDDYKPQPCATSGSAICESYSKDRMVDHASAHRGFDLRSEWVYAHYDEMVQAFAPICTKIGNCFTVKGNNWVYCVDMMKPDFLGVCDKYPEGTDEHRQCSMFAFTYYLGLGPQTKDHKAAQECVAAGPAQEGERTLEAWMEPTSFAADFNGKIAVYAYDSDTHIPVRARLSIDAGKVKSGEGPIATAGYPITWRAGLRRVPNANGHRDLIAPTMTLQATGYKPLTLPMAIEVPQLIVEMTPAATELKPGLNTFTITARDAKTGEPAEVRVMAGDLVLGNANAPVQLEIAAGKKRPEIWVTSLYDRYSDVVVAAAQ